jgi:Protein of unknown function (DUF3891)
VIITHREAALSLVEQVEHGRVAGELAAAWGGGEFERPRPYRSVQLAAARHDEGWRAWDARVLFNEARRRPLNFVEIEAAEHIRLYRQGLQRVSLEDVYSGVLVGMHWTGLYRGRWAAPGVVGNATDSDADRQRRARAVRSEETRWIEAKAQAWTEQEHRSAFETRLWHNYELLQLWDMLSLYLCAMPQEPATGSDAVPWGPQLGKISHEPQDVLLTAVARQPGTAPEQLRVSVRRHGEATVFPFPFAAPIEIEVAHRLVPDREWTRTAVRQRLRRTPSSVLRWRLVPADEVAR